MMDEIIYDIISENKEKFQSGEDLNVVEKSLL